MKSQCQPFLKNHRLLKLEGEVKPKAEVSFRSFTCAVSVTVPSWDSHVFTIVRNDYSKIWGLIPTEGCQLRTAPFSYLILTFISGDKVPEATWASLLPTLFLFLTF